MLTNSLKSDHPTVPAFLTDLKSIIGKRIVNSKRNTFPFRFGWNANFAEARTNQLGSPRKWLAPLFYSLRHPFTLLTVLLILCIP